MKIQLLNDEQIEQIKKATEDILENVGFRVTHKELFKKIKEAGAKVDENSMNVKVPSALLRELLSTIPPSYTIKGIDGREHIIGGDNQYVTSLVTDPWIIDYETKEPRRPCLDDIKRNTIIAQELEDVAIICLMDFPVTDHTDSTSNLRALEIHLLNHTKHYLVDAASLDYLDQWKELSKILSDGKSLSENRIMTVLTSIVSPLCLEDVNAEMIIFATENSLPIHGGICPIAGATSPYSKISTLVQANTELIFLAALTQLLNQGNPMNYLLGPSVSNMRTGNNLYYTIDKFLWKIASIEIGKSYNMPVTAACGGTLSHRYDMQSGAESMLNMLTAQNPGANILSGLGSCYNANGMSSEMMIMQSEWLQVAKYLSRGINMEFFNEGNDSIKAQGPGGNFLIDDLTLKLLRSDEFFKSNLFDISGGCGSSTSLLENAHRRVDEMTENYKSPVPQKIQENLKRYFHGLYNEMI